MGVVVWEGDANLFGDFLNINGQSFANATNQSYNPWNGTITDNGVHVTTKKPNYTNQMGIDIDQFDVGTGYGIAPNATSVTLQFGTTSDKYFPGVFTFTVKMKDSGPLYLHLLQLFLLIILSILPGALLWKLIAAALLFKEVMTEFIL